MSTTTAPVSSGQAPKSTPKPVVKRRSVDSWWARWIVPAVLPILIVTAYAVYAEQAANPYFPTIPRILDAAGTLWIGDGFTRHVVPSLSNLFIGYFAGLVIGLAAGVLLGLHDGIRQAWSPVVYFGLTLPPVALLPIFLIVFGIGSTMQRAVIALSVFFIVVINTADGVRTTDPVLFDVSAVYRVPRWRIITQFVLPAASAHILAAARVGLAAALLVMVVGEMVGASRGIGAVTLLAQQEFAYDRMWAGIALLAALGVVLNLGFLAIERRLLHILGVDDATPKGV